MFEDMLNNGYSGGAAAAGGMNFQHRVAAWIAVNILAEKSVSPPWDLPAYITLERIECETGHHVDDIFVRTSDGGRVFIQVKKVIQLSPRENSELASVISQFVHEFLEHKHKNDDLNPENDCLVLVTSPQSSKKIRLHLWKALRRLGGLSDYELFMSASVNKDEREALLKIVDHVERSWNKITGERPSNKELKKFLSLIQIQTLDVNNGGREEREAKHLLRNVILENPDQADSAWNFLIDVCANLAAQKSGIDRKGLQTKLLKAGYGIQVIRGYRDDIQKLREHSEQNFEKLKTEHSQINVGSVKVKIERKCVDVLRQLAEEGSILVTGEPGVGKSSVLHDFIEKIRGENRDYILLSADRLGAASLGQLRMELGLEHDLIKVINNWPGIKPAFLVIDALDTVRGRDTGRVIRDLIRQVIKKNGRWRVVAAIRKYDLRNSWELKQLFVGHPVDNFKDPEFADILHLNVPALSDSDFSQISEQSIELYRIIGTASNKLRELLHVPFNLWLVAQILEAGVPHNELAPIRTELELLDLYWKYWVIRNDGYGDAREAVVGEACRKMIANRELKADRGEIVGSDTSKSKPLDELLGSQVLTEWRPSSNVPPDRYTIAFPHNILFDYAVERTLLRGRPRKFIELLENDPGLVIMIRPSLKMHFRYLWTVDETRNMFWEAVFQAIQSDKIPEIGKLIGPSVAEELFKSMDDLKPMLSNLENTDIRTQKLAEQALQYFKGAIFAEIESKSSYIREKTALWSELLEHLSKNLTESLASIILPLLLKITEKPEKLTSQEKENLGSTARRILKFARERNYRNRWITINSLRCVCRTFESDPDASAELIRKHLTLSHIKEFGYEELPVIARELERLIPLDPKLVEDIYRSAFSYRETSENPTPIGYSQIIPMHSTRQQDYDLALYELAEKFSTFLEHSPDNAVKSLISALESYVKLNQGITLDEEKVLKFNFMNLEAKYHADGSGIWDENRIYDDSNAIKMLDTFQNFLENLSKHPDNISQIRHLIQLIVSENKLAVLWRRILLVGARYPDTFGKEIIPLAWAIPILVHPDTITPAGEFLKVIFPLLSEPERQQIEKTILNIPYIFPKLFQEGNHESAEYTRNRLLGCLPFTELVTEEAQRLLEQLRASKSIPPNEPSLIVGSVEFYPDTEEEYLRDEGVSIETQSNRKVLELNRPVKEFADEHLNSVPSPEKIQKVFPALKNLHEMLSLAEPNEVNPKVAELAWNYLAASCNYIGRIDELSKLSEIGNFVYKVLLEASNYPSPARRVEDDIQFDEHPNRGSLAPRLTAAHGLMFLSRIREYATPELLNTIKRLSKDPVPAVRYQIVSNLHLLFNTERNLMWQLIEDVAFNEDSYGVLQGFLDGPLRWLSRIEPERVAKLTKAIFDRVQNNKAGFKKVRKLCVQIFTNLYIWKNEPLSEKEVYSIVTYLTEYPVEARVVLNNIREALKYRINGEPNDMASFIRQRARNLVKDLFDYTFQKFVEFEKKYDTQPFHNLPEQIQDRIRSLIRLIESIVNDVYFASGAYEAKNQKGTEDRHIRKPDPMLYKEFSDLFDKFQNVDIPNIIHRFVETLEFFIPVNPSDVLQKIARAVKAGKKKGYPYDSLAVDLIVRIINRYLADYRHIFQKDSNSQEALIEILDIFVKAGWPRTWRLVYRLEEIFR